MPCWSFASSSASDELRRFFPSLFKHSRWATKDEGRRPSSMNKLAFPVPVHKELPCCDSFAGSHRGGGEGVELQWTIWIWRLGCGSTSWTKSKEQRRPLVSSESGGRWAASFALLATLLVEGRPLGATAQASARSTSSSRHDALREAVLLGRRFHPLLLWLRQKAEAWRVIASSGSSPAAAGMFLCSGGNLDPIVI